MKMTGRLNKYIELCLLLVTAMVMGATGVAAVVSIFNIQIIERQVIGENTLVRVKQGDAIVLNWQTDETVTVHLHGYDIEKTIIAGKVTSISFTAHATGRFPVTSHGFENQHDGHGHKTLLYFEVYPE